MRKELIVEREPKSPISESFKTIRTNVQFINAKNNLKKILITSSMPEEGKSFIATNLAIAFAHSGKKVLIIDADMRKGNLDKTLQVIQKVGLSNYLYESSKDEKEDILKYICDTEIENLSLIQSGDVPSNPSELIESPTVRQMLDKLEEIFDIIILDGTPCSLVTDSVLLSRLVDTTLVVVEQSKTKKDELKKIKRSIENVGGKIGGVILNKIDLNNEDYRNAYYYGYIKK